MTEHRFWQLSVTLLALSIGCFFAPIVLTQCNVPCPPPMLNVYTFEWATHPIVYLTSFGFFGAAIYFRKLSAAKPFPRWFAVILFFLQVFMLFMASPFICIALVIGFMIAYGRLVGSAESRPQQDSVELR